MTRAESTDRAVGRRRPLIAVVSALVIGVALVALITGRFTDGDATVATTTPSGSAGSGSISPTSAAPSAPQRTAVPVYWVGTANGEPALYREFRTVPDRGTLLETAVRAVMEQIPLDPDYRTPWRGPDVISTRTSSKGITVDVSANVFGAAGIDPALARAAVQQLVWTATAAAGANLPVTVLVDGERGFRAWGSVPLGDPIAREASARASLWVTSPQEGARLPRASDGTVRVTGDGQAFEGTFSWRIADRTGGAVASGVAMGRGDVIAPFAFSARLPADGTYVVTVFEADESNGESGAGPEPNADTKTFTVG